MKTLIRRFICFCPSSEVSPEDILGGEHAPHRVHAFSLKELEAATCGFHLLSKIGEGGFGSVYKGKLKDGKIVAIKVLSAKSKQGEREFMSEIASISNVRHQNVVRLHGACVHGPKRFLVYDYMENGSLAQILFGNKRRGKFGWKARREISLGIAHGLAHIHENVKPHIVHRDIKASNILLDGKLSTKVSDFGLSKLFTDSTTHISTRVAGTLGYLAPEYAITGRLTRKSDVYSFGVLLLEIVSGRKAIDFDLQLGEHFLVEKAWEMYKAGKILQLVDPALKSSSISEMEATRFLKVGLLCVQEKVGIRPSMSMATKMLRGELNTDIKEIAEPGLISNIMDVKIGRSTPNPSSSPTRFFFLGGKYSRQYPKWGDSKKNSLSGFG